MKKLIDVGFFNRNTDKGIERYLSGLGFDLGFGYDVEPGPTKKLVWVVEKKEPKSSVKSRASVKKASRS